MSDELEEAKVDAAIQADADKGTQALTRENLIGAAAAAAAYCCIAEPGALAIGTFEWGELAEFCMSATPSGETLFRMAAAKQMHVFAPGSFHEMTPSLQAWFKVFAACARGIHIALLVDAEQHKAVIPNAKPVPLHETIFERHGRMDERIGAQEHRPGMATSTAEIPVSRPEALPAGEFEGDAGDEADIPPHMRRRDPPRFGKAPELEGARTVLATHPQGEGQTVAVTIPQGSRATLAHLAPPAKAAKRGG